MLDGEIEVKSSKERGSIFTLCVPSNKNWKRKENDDALKEVAVSASVDNYIDTTKTEIDKDYYFEAFEEHKHINSKALLKGKKMLVVDANV